MDAPSVTKPVLKTNYDIARDQLGLARTKGLRDMLRLVLALGKSHKSPIGMQCTSNARTATWTS